MLKTKPNDCSCFLVKHIIRLPLAKEMQRLYVCLKIFFVSNIIFSLGPFSISRDLSPLLHVIVFPVCHILKSSHSVQSNTSSAFIAVQRTSLLFTQPNIGWQYVICKVDLLADVFGEMW